MGYYLSAHFSVIYTRVVVLFAWVIVCLAFTLLVLPLDFLFDFARYSCVSQQKNKNPIETCNASIFKKMPSQV